MITGPLIPRYWSLPVIRQRMRAICAAKAGFLHHPWPSWERAYRVRRA